MKTIKYKIILFFIFLFLIKNGFSQKNNPTFNETVTWIEGKLNYFNKGVLLPYEISVKYDKLTKSLKYTTLHLNENLTSNQYSIYYLPIKLINPSNIQITEENGTYWLYLYANDDKKSFKWESWFVKEGENKKIVLMESKVFFNIPPEVISKEANLPERLKKAFINLIKISGGKGEVF